MDGIQQGMQICRNADRKFLKLVEKSHTDRRIPIKLQFSETPSGFQLWAQDQDGNSVVVPLNIKKSPAQKPERALETLKRQLTRLGDSEFVSDGLEIDLTEPYFFPISSLNALRRELVMNLGTERTRNYPRLTGGAIRNNFPYPKKKLNFLGNVLNTRAEAFYHRHGVQEIEPAAESGIDLGGRKVMTTKHCLKYEFGGCRHLAQPRHLNEPLYLTTEDGLQLRLVFNCRDCLMEIYFEQNGP